MDLKVGIIANTIIGRKGNIGVRTGKIIDELKKRNIEYLLISRGIEGSRFKGMHMGIFKHIARILNAIRIYIYPNFDHRIYDIRIFEVFTWFCVKLKWKQWKDVDVIHLWEYSPALIRFFESMNKRVILEIPIVPANYKSRLLTECEDSNIPLSSEAWVNWENETFNACAEFIVPSGFVSSELNKIVKEKNTHCVPFGTDISELEEPNANLEKKGVEFCFAGNISHRKGINYLLKAFSDSCFENDTLHLYGRIYPEFKRLVKEHNANVILHGYTSDIKKKLQQHDVYVFPSLMEGSSKSIYEAMERALPVIATYESGSIIRDGLDGFIIDKANVDQLKDKMNHFKKHPEAIQEMGRSARSRISEYTWEIYTHEIVNIYKIPSHNLS